MNQSGATGLTWVWDGEKKHLRGIGENVLRGVGAFLVGGSKAMM